MSINHKCPLTLTEFKGECKVKNCYAHCGKEKHSSGCYYNYIGNHTAPSEKTIIKAFNLKTVDFKRLQKLGTLAAQSYLIWIDLAENYQPEPPECLSCFYLGCKGGVKCKERTKVIEELGDNPLFLEGVLNNHNFWFILEKVLDYDLDYHRVLNQHKTKLINLTKEA
jgi:hypothetical protein